MPMLANIHLMRVRNNLREVLLGEDSHFGECARLDDSHWEMEGASCAQSNLI